MEPQYKYKHVFERGLYTSVKEHRSSVIHRKELEKGFSNVSKFIEFVYGSENVKPYLFQRLLITEAIKGLLPCAFTFDVYNTNQARILNAYCLERIALIVNATASRRFGKSKIGAKIIAGAALFFKNPENGIKPFMISVFSQGHSASKKTLKAVGDELKEYEQRSPNGPQEKIFYGEEKITIQDRYAPERQTVITALCGNGNVSIIQFIYYYSYHMRYGQLHRASLS